ncbi:MULTISPECIES: hypothetical protein [unclassified Arcicella]|uniref:hypothetical protein n=1 Tax=unclassified Arcicella TaxID=2644986 RepID=UPI00285B407C|nr:MULTISPECIES: hypothetical protein [unclassified Arcicella]MDR6562013.1 uncharacterized protein YdiU (UPF0061 family) [Arcicella sp. BE51]MDR6811885.1 uncharacterized protein YdiU (UPF0061 family) [Arcicella sp. BE140]MDR6822915.1 uncharacterized protein YdiU (UPF0061 family) [Arcicella sp. BE139]
MTTKIFISSILVLILTSCNNTSQQDNAKSNETPKALEDNSSSDILLSKSRSESLLENLYSELINKNTDLKTFEDKLEQVNNSKRDSIYLFNNFNEKNIQYYDEAKDYTSEIQDSLLRDKMRKLIAGNLKKYNSSITKHNKLLKTIESNNLTISDIHTALKIVKTLPLMEKYQRDNLPKTKSLESYIKQQNEIIRQAELLIKK